MSRAPIARLAFGLIVTLAAAAAARADDPAEEARRVAVKVTTAGAALFDARDAKGLSLTYVEDARLEVSIRDKDSGELKTETKVGRTEIEGYYQELFKSDRAPHARNTVEHARLLGDDLLTISGFFELDTEAAESMKLPFLQVRARRGGEWRVLSLQVFVLFRK